jgi:hypothetical protein
MPPEGQRHTRARQPSDPTPALAADHTPQPLNVLAFYRGAEGDVGRNALFGMKPRGSDPPGARLGTQARLHAAWEISTIGSLPTVTANSLA